MKKAMLYTKSPIPSHLPSHPVSHAEIEEPEPIRVPKPPTEVVFVRKLDHMRPWANLKNASDGVRYIPVPALEQVESGGAEAGSTGWQTRRNKGGKEKE